MCFFLIKKRLLRKCLSSVHRDRYTVAIVFWVDKRHGAIGFFFFFFFCDIAHYTIRVKIVVVTICFSKSTMKFNAER